jgi:hypothetical protein
MGFYKKPDYRGDCAGCMYAEPDGEPEISFHCGHQCNSLGEKPSDLEMCLKRLNKIRETAIREERDLELKQKREFNNFWKDIVDKYGEEFAWELEKAYYKN